MICCSRDIALVAGTVAVCGAAAWLLSAAAAPPATPVERKRAGFRVAPTATVIKVTDTAKVPT